MLGLRLLQFTNRKQQAAIHPSTIAAAAKTTASAAQKERLPVEGTKHKATGEEQIRDRRRHTATEGDGEGRGGDKKETDRDWEGQEEANGVRRDRRKVQKGQEGAKGHK